MNLPIKYALKFVPAEKISLGIPVVSLHWVTRISNRLNPKSNFQCISKGIDYSEMVNLTQKFHLKLEWQNEDKIWYAFFKNNYLYEYLFAEDAKTFQEKMELAKRYNLRGISVFAIGMEDPKVWEVVP